MRASLAFAVSLGFGLSAALGLASTPADNCAVYPIIQTKLEKCKTATPFCEALLGRGPMTMTQSYATYTKTISNTLDWLEVSSTTITGHTTLPVTTTYSTATVLECATATGLGAARPGVLVAQTPAAAAAGASCGVGHYASSAVSSACSCQIDSTVIVASKTKTKKMGTTISFTSSTATSYTTMTTYLATTLATTTRMDANCYPPSNSSCTGAFVCTDPFYESWKCGSGAGPNGYYCVCGLDVHQINSCYYSGFTCADQPTCNYDYDCEDGHFCLYNGFDNYADCCSNVCVKADVCLHDQASSTISGGTVATAVRKVPSGN